MRARVINVPLIKILVKMISRDLIVMCFSATKLRLCKDIRETEAKIY